MGRFGGKGSIGNRDFRIVSGVIIPHLNSFTMGRLVGLGGLSLSSALKARFMLAQGENLGLISETRKRFAKGLWGEGRTDWAVGRGVRMASRHAFRGECFGVVRMG